jgi:hypothetical protein
VDLLTFVDHLIGHLAWPAAIVVVATIFRKEFNSVFNRARLLKFAGVEVSLEEQVQELAKAADEGGITTLYPKESFSERFREEIRVNPKWAFLEIWIEVEQNLKKIVEGKSQIYRGPINAIAELETDSYITKQEAEVLRRLSQVRNQIVHGDSELAEVDVNPLIGAARSMRDRLAQKAPLPTTQDDPFR